MQYFLETERASGLESAILCTLTKDVRQGSMKTSRKNCQGRMDQDEHGADAGQ